MSKKTDLIDKQRSQFGQHNTGQMPGDVKEHLWNKWRAFSEQDALQIPPMSPMNILPPRVRGSRIGYWYRYSYPTGRQADAYLWNAWNDTSVYPDLLLSIVQKMTKSNTLCKYVSTNRYSKFHPTHQVSVVLISLKESLTSLHSCYRPATLCGFEYRLELLYWWVVSGKVGIWNSGLSKTMERNIEIFGVIELIVNVAIVWLSQPLLSFCRFTEVPNVK